MFAHLKTKKTSMKIQWMTRNYFNLIVEIDSIFFSFHFVFLSSTLRQSQRCTLYWEEGKEDEKTARYCYAMRMCPCPHIYRSMQIEHFCWQASNLWNFSVFFPQRASRASYQIDEITADFLFYWREFLFNLNTTSVGANSQITFAKCNNSRNEAMHLSFASPVSNVLNIIIHFYSMDRCYVLVCDNLYLV